MSALQGGERRLCAVLQERSPGKLDAFFRAFGAAEAACMCYQLAAAQLSAVPAVRCLLPQRFVQHGLQQIDCDPAPWQ